MRKKEIDLWAFALCGLYLESEDPDQDRFLDLWFGCMRGAEYWLHFTKDLR